MVYGEDRGARLREALAAYDEALDLRRDVPLTTRTTQNNRAMLLSDFARACRAKTGARGCARPWPPTTKRWTCAGTCRWLTRRPRTTGPLLRALASFPGEDRGARLREALAAYDEALDKLRDVPLDYATTQNNRASTAE